jgi:hypothetical protein
MRISKISKYLGIKNIILIGSHIKENYGGRSFYNDGTYHEHEYELNGLKNKYSLFVKVSGKLGYYLINNTTKETMYFLNQKTLIDFIKESELK